MKMNIQENSTVTGRDGRRYTLGKEVGAGGEGIVFRIVGMNLVAKFYKKVDPHTAGKIRYMVEHQIPDLTDPNGKKILSLAWPQDLLYDNSGNFIGYTMPFVGQGVEICTVARGCDMPKAKALFPHYNRLVNLRVAVNLARSVSYLHERNCIVGDLNCKNIMVCPDCSITILDNDSFDMLDEADGTHYRCTAGTQDYLAPELQGRNLRDPGAIFSVYSDDFALAIHIFQLLMNNFHPFTGKNLVVLKSSTSTNQRLEHMCEGKCAYIHSYPDLSVPVNAPLLAEMVTTPLVRDFVQTFDYTSQTLYERMRQRTTASQWLRDLQIFLNQFADPQERIQCSENPEHYYLRRIGQCGLCRADHRLEDFKRIHTATAGASAPPPAVQQAAAPATKKMNGFDIGAILILVAGALGYLYILVNG